MSSNSERQTYLILRGEGNVFEALIGPIKGGTEQANKLLALMAMLDRQLTDSVDWDDPAVCAAYFWEHVAVAEFSAGEVHALMGDDIPTDSVDNANPTGLVDNVHSIRSDPSTGKGKRGKGPGKRSS